MVLTTSVTRLISVTRPDRHRRHRLGRVRFSRRAGRNGARVRRHDHPAFSGRRREDSRVQNGKYEDVSCFTMVDDNSIGADMCMDPQEGTPRVVKAEDARGVGCENRRGEEVIEVCITVHPTHGTDRRLHVELEPRSSFDATLRARGREVRRDELVSNKFHVCVGQKIGVPPKLREHGVGSGVVSVGEHEEDEEEDFNAFIANL